jgi:hypothetical protein
MSDYQEVKQLHHEIKKLADENRLLRRALERLTADERIGEAAKPTLTDAERFVLREVRDIYADEDDVKCNEIAAVLDGLLERVG